MNIYAYIGACVVRHEKHGARLSSHSLACVQQIVKIKLKWQTVHRIIAHTITP